MKTLLMSRANANAPADVCIHSFFRKNGQTHLPSVPSPSENPGYEEKGAN